MLQCLVIVISALTVTGSYAADLTVSVVGLKNNRGDVHIALYDRPEKFPDSGGMKAEEDVSIRARQARAVFNNLSPGKYAIAVYHDENGNHEFDQGFLGIPLEDFGFSNGATAFFAPPSFKDAQFILANTGSTTVIDLGN